MLEKGKKKSLIISSCERHSGINVNIRIIELKRFLLATVLLLEGCGAESDR